MNAGRRLLGDRYQLESVLATGGMGRVWRAQDTRLQRPVAVKILRSELTGDPTFLHRFRAEARHAAMLTHPAIAAVHDYGETTDADGGAPLAYLVMELVPGESLSDVLARTGRLDIPVALRIVRQTADALAAAHAAGVVHRDVKPGNVLIAPDGGVKITDFGIARSAASVSMTRTGQVLGTPHYLSPEQAQGEAATPASDVYALGVVAYECLAGRRPFEGENSVRVAAMQIRDVAPPLPADVPGAVRRLVERAMAKDPAARFPDGAAFRDAVDALLATPTQSRHDTVDLGRRSPAPTAVLPVLPAAVPAADRPAGSRAGGRRHAGWLVGGAALATLLLVLALVAWVGRGGRDASTAAGTSAAPTTASSSAPASAAPTSAAPTSAAPTAVDLVAGRYAGRPLADVQAELTALGLVVRPRPTTTNDVPDGQVIAVEPVGQVVVGQTVSVTYAVAPAAHAPNGNGHGNGHGHRSDGDPGD